MVAYLVDQLGSRPVFPCSRQPARSSALNCHTTATLRCLTADQRDLEADPLFASMIHYHWQNPYSNPANPKGC